MADILELFDLDELRHQVRQKIATWPPIRMASSMPIISIRVVHTLCGSVTHLIR